MIEIYKKKAVFGKIAGHTVPIVSCPNMITSELLGELAVGQPFAASYSDKVDKRGWSLRSSKEGLNVADIAATFGGGGHPNAAGFATTITEQVFVVLPEK
jgi:oligoribonuclease NrnB/cAMP/cGMP phosphodiesterase (DHH superfamily)